MTEPPMMAPQMMAPQMIAPRWPMLLQRLLLAPPFDDNGSDISMWPPTMAPWTTLCCNAQLLEGQWQFDAMVLLCWVTHPLLYKCQSSWGLLILAHGLHVFENLPFLHWWIKKCGDTIVLRINFERRAAMEFVLQQTMNANADRDDVSVIHCIKNLCPKYFNNIC